VAEIPFCARSVKNRGCAKSDVRLTRESDDVWVFECQTCRAIQVVSKDGVKDRSKFEVAAERKRQQEEIERRWQSRRRTFA
jgi:hypothetical protein